MWRRSGQWKSCNMHHKVILNADDFGKSPIVNGCIALCFKQGTISRTSIMVNMPDAESAAELAKREGFFSQVGLHLNLTEGTPLTEEIKQTPFCNEDGEFTQWALKNSSRIWIAAEYRRIVQREIAMQCQRYLDMGFKLAHMDSHQHVHTNLSMLPLIIGEAEHFGFQSIRLSRNIPYAQIQGARYIYKRMVNRKISKFNDSHNKNGMAVSLFGGMEDAEIFLKEKGSENAALEIMMHPGTLCDGAVLDALNGKCIEKWAQEYIR